jgi:hypothetical protein
MQDLQEMCSSSCLRLSHYAYTMLVVGLGGCRAAELLE